MTLMRMLTLNSYHSQIHNLVMVNELWAMLPTGLIADGGGYGCITAPNPSHGVMVDEYVQVPL